MVRPYVDADRQGSSFTRTFSSSAASSEMVWHRDARDRLVECIETGPGWMLQRENELPTLISVGVQINISSGLWHRLIAGKGDLVVRITEF